MLTPEELEAILPGYTATRKVRIAVTPERTNQLKGIAHALDDYHAGRRPSWVSGQAWEVLDENYKDAYVSEWSRCDQDFPRNSEKRVDT